MSTIDLNLSEGELETAVLDALADEDEDIDVGQALAVLVYVVAGLCCCGTTLSPDTLASQFAVALREQVAGHDDEPRMLS